MASDRKLTPETRADIEARYRAGQSMRVIAAAYGRNRTSIRATLLRMNVPLRLPGCGGPRRDSYTEGACDR